MGNAQGKPVSFADEVNLNHFRLLRVVGKGAFGKVRIVERKDTGLTFALKYIRKDEVIRSESVRNIIRERRMLEHLNHPFICNLRYSFQDIEYMYLVVDLMNGGDLRFHISRKSFTEEAVRFWIAELGCALRYIHRQGIIHRDVKPDNILLDSDGHVHLADFNVASDFTPGKPLTGKSGTLSYLAPEVFKGVGYSSGADWWSLGVVFYECIFNRRPFEASSSTVLSELIVKAQPNFPVTSPPVSISCLHAISSALEEDPMKRIGSMGFESFATNPFFQCIDFEKLQEKEIDPVFVPSSEKTNFDATYDLEELLLEEAPLEARARRQKPREQLKEGASEKEVRTEELYRLIETGFHSFNYTEAAYARLTAEGMIQSLPTPDNALIKVQTSSTSHQESSDRASTKSVSILSGRKHRGSKSPRSSPSGSPPYPHTLNEPPPLPSDQLQQIKASHSQYKTITPPRNLSPPRASPSRPPTSNPQPIHGPRSQTQSIKGGNAHNAVLQSPSSGSPLSANLSSYQQSYNCNQRSTSTRNQSTGGGVQVVLGETGSWTDLAQKDNTLPADAKLVDAGPGVKPSGMLGFLGRKKGHSPKPPQQRGVLGKEGARVVISNG